MKRTVLMLFLMLISVTLLFSAGINYYELQESEITSDVIEMIRQNNSRVERSAPVWDFGTTSVPVPLPRPGDDPFLEDQVWTKDFASHVVYSGSGELFLFYNSVTQRFNISTDPVNPLKLHFSIKAGMENWYGSETMIIGVSDSPMREPSRAYATAVVRITVSPVDDPIILSCPPQFQVLDEFGNLLHYQIEMQEETPLTINFLDYEGIALIKTVDDLTNPSNYDFFVTQTQQPPYNVSITQTPAYVGKTVTFTPRPGFFGEVRFAITNTDNNINGFLDTDPDFNTCLNVFVLKVVNVNDDPVIRSWTPAAQTLNVNQHASQSFSVRAFDEDDYYLGLVPPLTEMNFEWRITGSEYGSPLDQVIAHTTSSSLGNPLDVLSSIDYTFNFPGAFQISAVVSDGSVALPPLVWNVNVMATGPEFTIPGGVYTQTINVGLFSTVSPDAPIYYTLDGSLPDTNSLLFDPANPIVISEGVDDVVVTITAVYYDAVYGQSGYSAQTYRITGTVMTPVFNLQPLPFIYTSAQQLVISTSTPNSSIRYTLDGTDPSPTEGILYAGPVNIPVDTILNVKAIAYKDTWLSSSIASGSFQVTGQVRIDDLSFDKVVAPLVHVLPVGADLTINVTNLQLFPADPGTRLYFTTDNSTPTEASTEYVGQSITITQSTIIRFRAFRENWAPSAVQFFEFLINGQVVIGTYGNGTIFSPNPGVVYQNQVLVSINNTIPAQNSQIFYTVSTDPNIAPPDPTTSSTLYLGSGQIVVPVLQPYNISSLRIKARAFHSFLEPSPVYEALYTVTGKVQPPIFNPAGGAYASPQLVSIVTYAPGGEIRYTTSNDINVMPPDPTQTDNLYTAPIAVPLGTKVIKARVFKADWTPSDVVTSIYFIGVLEAPTFSPVEEMHYAAFPVTINHSDPNATIRWVEGTGIPTQTSPIYSSPIMLTESKTLTARAFRQDWNPSEPVTKTYTITGTLSPLSFSLPNLPGSYENSVIIGIHSDDPGVTIRVTLDGTEPTLTNGQTYTVPFQLNTTTLVRARAFKTDWLPTPILDGLYEIVSTVASPRFTPPPGTYTAPQDVYILSYTPGADIRYTISTVPGVVPADPSSVNGTLYDADSPIVVNNYAYIKAIAYTGSGLNSVILSGEYFITGTVATPVFAPAPGVYAAQQSVSISTTPADATIYYTTDGTAPGLTSAVFDPAFPILVTESTVIKAIAVKAGWINSAVATGSYVINGKVSTPLFIPAGGSYVQEQNVAISVYPSDANIYFTTDGSLPVANPALLYSGPIPVTQTTTIRAFATMPGWQDSDPAIATYTLNVLPPLVSHASGLYPNPISVSFTNQNSGATIYYTTDGSDPLDIPANLYGGPFAVNTNTRVRAIAYRAGWTPSPELDLNYVINPAITAPVFSVAHNSILSSEFNLSISTTPADATIYYTLDGTDPTEASLIYGGPILINKNTLVKARAYKAFHNPSSIAAAQYYLQVTDPIVNFASGNYFNYIQVSLTKPTPGSEIRYTLDGTNPSSTVGTLYTNVAIPMNANQTLKAIAYRTDWLDSSVVSRDYTFSTAPIVFTPPAGSYEGDIPVQLTTTTQGAAIHYTLDGSIPTTTTGMVYGAPIILNEPTTIKAIAFKDAMPPSTGEASYTFKLPLPTFTFAEGIYNEGFDLGMNSSVVGSSIYYTTDGNDPLTLGLLYSPTVRIENPATVKAVTVMPGWNPSEVAQATYQFKVATPSFTPNPGLYALPQNIGISTLTTGDDIYYTTDESTPDGTSTQYTAPVLVESGLIVFKAIGKKAGWLDSDIGEAGYIIGSGGPAPSIVETPVLNPAPGLYTTAQFVSISTSTPLATIRYTLDGTDPSPTNGMDYTAAFPLGLETTTTVKAIAYKDGWTNSQMAAGTYIITGTVADVSFNPAGGLYTAAQTIILSTITEGATIRYTTDGTDPVANSPIYNAGIVLSNNSLTIVKARAFKSGWTPSAIGTETYNITGQVTLISPIVDVAPGTYSNPITVSVVATSFPSDAVIRYTTDGSDPTEASPAYSAAFSVGENSSLTLKLKGFKTNWISSETFTAVYNVTGTAQLPVLTFDPLPGTYQTAQMVTVYPAAQPSDAILRYTLDGSEPSEFSPAYSSPISLGLNSTTTIKVKAFKAGWLPSPTISGIYVITGQVVYNSPVFSPAPGIYQTAQNISINTAVPAGAVVHYTLDGSEPDQTSPVYSGSLPLALGTTMTVKTKAYLADWTPSLTHEATYTTTGQVTIQTPVFDPLPGLYTSPQMISVTDQTIPAGAVMRYTTDGSDPTEASPIYSGSFPVNRGETLNLKVRAFAANWLASVIYSGSYTVTGQVTLASPVFTPAAGVYTSIQYVTLNTNSDPVGATLRYTTDGSEPSETSPVYTAAIPVTSQTIKVKAFKTDWLPSITYEASYTITGQVTISAPVFSPAAGTYQTAQNVIVSGVLSPADAVIRYTTDGTDPTLASPVYAGPIAVALNSNLNLKLRAFRTDWIPSVVYSASYVVTGQVQLPAMVFSPIPGTYQTAQSVSLMPASLPATATLRYTLDGSEPTLLSPAYSAPLNLPMNSTTTIRVKAFETDWTPSETVSGTYLITGQVTYNSPVFSPAPGIYQTAQNISINSTYPADAVIRFTTDGSEPDESSAIYSGTISLPLNTSLTIKTKAYLADWTPSDTHTGFYTTTGAVSMELPIFSPAPGLYTSPQNVSINTNTAPAGATLRYTIDGSDPSEASPIYSGAIPVNTGEIVTIRVRAYAANWLPSAIHTGTYTVTGQVSLNSPVFTPAAGIYTTAQMVTLNTSSNPAGATLRFTTDGSEPSETSPVYTSAIAVNNTQTIKVKAFKTDWVPSITYEAAYSITGQVTLSTPLFNPLPGVYQTAQIVNVVGSPNPVDAVIRFTTDGTDPTASSPIYASPFSIGLNSNLTIKLRAFRNDWLPSPVYTGTYTVTGQVQLPAVVFTPAAGIYQTAQSITLNTGTTPAGATLRYTLDGSEPNEMTSPAYTVPIQLPLNSNTTIKVKAFLANWTPSATVTAQYLITGTLAINAPVFDPPAGLYYQAQTVTVNSASQAGAVIRYTLDGTDPTANSPVYSAALNIPQGTTVLKVRAFLANWTSSPVYNAAYQVTGQVALPTPFFSPAPGTYTTAQQVTLNQATVPTGAQIRYTTDGSIPTSTSPLYTGPITVNLNTIRTIRAIAYLTDWLPSEVASATYTITGQAQINGTVFTPGAGLYTTPISVSINTATTPAGATLRYSIDGSEPTVTSPEYSAAIPLMGDNTTTVKVKVFATGWIPSETYSATYVITGRVSIVGDLFDPPAGTYTTAQSVSIIAQIYPTPDEIRYTIDGTEPNATSPIYSAPIDVPLNTQGFEIRAKAYLANWIPSPTISAIYNITGQVALNTPAISPAPGTYTTAQTIVIAAPVLPQAADIRYTLDGTEPTLTSPAYQSPFQLTGNTVTTVKLKGFMTDWIPSPTVTAVYNITGTVAEPVFMQAGGLYAETFDLELTSATEGAEIRYTLDGTDPIASSALYTTPINIPYQSQSLEIKAKAFKTDWVSSAITSQTYSVLRVPISVRAYSYSGYIRVLWNSPLPSRNLDGFKLYRQATGDAGFTPLNNGNLINTFDGGFYYYDDYVIQVNTTYTYRVTAVYNGEESLPSQTTSIEYQAGDLQISDNSHAFPNPAVTSTTIRLVLSRNDNVQVSVTIYDFAGKQIRTLTVPTTNTNQIDILWDLKNSSGTKVARGAYFARIVAIDGANRSERVLKIAVQ